MRRKRRIRPEPADNRSQFLLAQNVLNSALPDLLDFLESMVFQGLLDLKDPQVFQE